jgi:hypothetical protein
VPLGDETDPDMISEVVVGALEAEILDAETTVRVEKIVRVWVGDAAVTWPFSDAAEAGRSCFSSAFLTLLDWTIWVVWGFDQVSNASRAIVFVVWAGTDTVFNPLTGQTVVETTTVSVM